jgi:hypothetical protein
MLHSPVSGISQTLSLPHTFSTMAFNPNPEHALISLFAPPEVIAKIRSFAISLGAIPNVFTTTCFQMPPDGFYPQVTNVSNILDYIYSGSVAPMIAAIAHDTTIEQTDYSELVFGNNPDTIATVTGIFHHVVETVDTLRTGFVDLMQHVTDTTRAMQTAIPELIDDAVTKSLSVPEKSIRAFGNAQVDMLEQDDPYKYQLLPAWNTYQPYHFSTPIPPPQSLAYTAPSGKIANYGQLLESEQTGDIHHVSYIIDATYANSVSNTDEVMSDYKIASVHFLRSLNAPNDYYQAIHYAHRNGRRHAILYFDTGVKAIFNDQLTTLDSVSVFVRSQSILIMSEPILPYQTTEFDLPVGMSFFDYTSKDGTNAIAWVHQHNYLTREHLDNYTRAMDCAFDQSYSAIKRRAEKFDIAGMSQTSVVIRQSGGTIVNAIPRHLLRMMASKYSLERRFQMTKMRNGCNKVIGVNGLPLYICTRTGLILSSRLYALLSSAYCSARLYQKTALVRVIILTPTPGMLRDAREPQDRDAPGLYRYGYLVVDIS